MARPSSAGRRKVNEMGVTAWTARHPVGGPFTLGLVGGAIGWPTLYVGSAVTGFIVGRAGVGPKGRRMATIGFVVGQSAVFIAIIAAMVRSGCPSCVDAAAILPIGLIVLAIPFALGQRFGRRAHRRAALDAATRSDG